MKESQHTEWKESRREDYLRWVCGFANAEGGVLVIGRTSRGAAVGAARLLEEVPNKVRNLLGIGVAMYYVALCAINTRAIGRLLNMLEGF